MLLALDLATSTGATWGGLKGRPRTVTIRLPSDLPRALVSLRQWITMAIRTEQIEIVAIEEAMRRIDRFHGAAPLVFQTSLQAVAIEAVTSCGVPFHLVAPAKWRAHFLGNGNLKTEDAKRGAMKRCDQLGYAYDTHDAAESAGLWDYGVHTYLRRRIAA